MQYIQSPEKEDKYWSDEYARMQSAIRQSSVVKL